MNDVIVRSVNGLGGMALGLLLWCSCAGSSEPQKTPDRGSSTDLWTTTDLLSKTDTASNNGCDGACADVATGADSNTGCTTGLNLCGADCVDLKSDRNNCGKCGQQCEGEQTCVEGSCTCPNGDPPPCEQCKTTGQSCSGDECCEGLICGYYGSSMACKPPGT